MTYNYKVYNPEPFLEMPVNASRDPQYETGPYDYAIVHASQPYDDDAMLLRWHQGDQQWYASFAGFGAFGEEQDMKTHSDSGERAALVLIDHFGLNSKANELSPEDLSRMSPRELGWGEPSGCLFSWLNLFR